jgi:hypothetical protein
MEGFRYNMTDLERGIIPRATHEIFKFISELSNQKYRFMVRASYLQIYKEGLSDLLKDNTSRLEIREDRRKGVFVSALSEWVVTNPNDVINLLKRGTLCRKTAATRMNDVSSRSHAVFTIIVEQVSKIFILLLIHFKMRISLDPEGIQSSQIRVGKLNFVDLAGSERIRALDGVGERLEESTKINKSLSALGNVICALTKKRTHIPYRDSKVGFLVYHEL